jgi:hypothetical protein
MARLAEVFAAFPTVPPPTTKALLGSSTGVEVVTIPAEKSLLVDFVV